MNFELFVSFFLAEKRFFARFLRNFALDLQDSTKNMLAVFMLTFYNYTAIYSISQ